MVKSARTQRYRIGLVLVFAAMASVALLLSIYPQDPVAALNSGQYHQAANLLQNQLDNGNTLVATTLANLYYLGLGVDQDFNMSAALYARAAFAGNSAAQTNLGFQYYYGFGLTKDIQLAFAWFNLANDNGAKIAGKYLFEILSEQKLSPQMVQRLRHQYATVNNLPKP